MDNEDEVNDDLASREIVKTKIVKTKKDTNEISVGTFNKLARQYQDKYMDFDFYHDTYDKLLELISDEASIFEIACGPGNIAKYLLSKKSTLRFFGIDLAPSMVELAKENLPAHQFEVMDCRKMADIEQKFDVIISGFSTPYLDESDCENLIRDCRAKLKLGGIFYLSTMEDNDARSGLQTSSTGDQVYIYYHQFERFERYLNNNRFEVVEVERKAFPVESGEPTTDLFIYARAI